MLLNVITMSRYTYHGTLIPTKANVIHCGFCVVALSKHKITFFFHKNFQQNIAHVAHHSNIVLFFWVSKVFFFTFLFLEEMHDV